MAIVGINFSKINVEKDQVPKGKINISNNVSIKNVEETNFSLGNSKQKGVKFFFEFTSKYEPSYGNILFQGEVLYVGSEDEIKSILDKWSQEKKIEKALMTTILNNVLNKCNVQALILSQTMNMPSPIPMPKVSSDNNKNPSGSVNNTTQSS